MAARYTGRPWRARLLRAPKIALQVSERDGFVPLGDLARVRLGLKTGSDRFFFVEPLDPIPRGAALGARRARTTVTVRGRNGWEGNVNIGDLLPAAVNPHELDTSDGRKFAIPERTARLYLYPQDRAPAADLASYVERAEHDGVHRKELVASNADPRRWYRQTRGVLTPPWVLPYNSAYDYGAFDNPHGAVINGRFVGVGPGDDVNSEMLGAVLNSTLVVATRLMEGVATGTEGALDVGPPAARVMAVPDPRKFTDAGADAVADALQAIRASGFMPGAPDRHASAPRLRRDLDLAVLGALGMTRGEAQHLTGRLYQSYARWRALVEDTEAEMREHRRVMNAHGRGRGVDPVDLAARRVREELNGVVPLVPADVLPAGADTEPIDVAAAFRLPVQEPLMDAGLVPAADGETIDLGHWSRVRYTGELLALGFVPPIHVPVDPQVAEEAADAIAAARRTFASAAAEAARRFVTAPVADQVARAAERLWLRDCRERGTGATHPGITD